MTTLLSLLATPDIAPRAHLDILVDQLRGMSAWLADHPADHLPPDVSMSREARLYEARRRDVVARQRQGLVEWTARQLEASARTLSLTASPRVVLIHRNDWFTSKVAAGLAPYGISVVAEIENGAEGVGVVIAEQPDLVLVQDRLPMTSGLDVVRAVRRYAPTTLVMAQVESEGDIAAFLDAGALTAYPRRVPPTDIAEDLRALFGA